MIKWLPIFGFFLVSHSISGQNSGIQLLSRYDHALPAGGLVEITGHPRIKQHPGIYELSNTIAVSQIENTMDLCAFPNPSSGRVTIDLGTTYDKLYISITNICGQQVQKEIAENSKKVDLSVQQAPGVYFVNIETSEKTGSLKIVIE